MVESKKVKLRQKIKNCLIELLYEKSFYDIRVTEISKKSGITTATFYNYYQDKWDVLEEIRSELSDCLIEVALQIRQKSKEEFYQNLENGFEPDFMKFFDCLKTYEYHFRALFHPKSGLHFSDYLASKLDQTISKTFEISSIALKPSLKVYRKQIILKSYVGIFSTYVQSGCQESSQEMAELMTEFWKSPVLLEKTN